MTVSSALNRKAYTGDDATVAFATSPVVFFDESDLKVYVVTTATGAAVLKTITTDYTVSGGAGSTGTVTMLTAPASTETLVIVRELSLVQEVDFVNNEAMNAEVAEDALDKLTMMAQQLSARLDRAAALPDSDVTGADPELPTPEASTLLGWNSDGDALQNYSAGDISPDILVTPFIETVLDDTDEATARATLGLGDLAVLDTVDTAQIDDDAVTRAKVVAEVFSPRSVGRNITGQNNATNPNYQFDWNADEFVVQDSNGKSIRLTAVDVTVDITQSGANGLDTGSEANSTWYYGHIIYNPTTSTVAGLLSLSWTSPTLPAGYTFSAPIGAVYNASDGHLRAQRQRGSEITYNVNQVVLSGGTAATTTAVDMSLVVPPVALTYTGSFDGFVTATGAGAVNIAPTIELVSGVAWLTFAVSITLGAGAGWRYLPGNSATLPNVAQNFNYFITTTSGVGTSLSYRLRSYTLPIGGQ